MSAISSSDARSHPPAAALPDFLAGGGEMGALMRAHDWARTSVGAAQTWPLSLKTAVRIMLSSRQPMWIGWGESLAFLYNDAYRSIIGGKHPWALGRPTREVWREIWPEIEPLLAVAMRGDQGTYVEAQLLIMERNGYREETYYTYSYSPVPDEAGGIGGIICANTDDTRRVVGERQMALLREVAVAPAEARSLAQAGQDCARALGSNPHDLPFALIYVAAPHAHSFSLLGASGLAAADSAAPAEVAGDGASVAWPLPRALDNGGAIVTVDAAAFPGAVPCGAWPQPPRQAALVPVSLTGDETGSSVLVAGLNPYRLFDDDYRAFLRLVATEIGAAIANALAYEAEQRRAEALAQIDRAKTAFFGGRTGKRRAA